MKKISYFFPLFLAIAVAFGFYLGKNNNFPYLTSNSVSADRGANSKKKLFQVLEIIENDYVDSISSKDLTEKTIKQLLSNLDPHSIYIPYRKYNREEEELRGEFAGVGVKFIILNDTLNVTNVIADGPSSRAGIKNGDIILKIDTSQVAGVNLKNNQVMKLLKGKPSTEVTVKILRNNQVFDKEIVRGLIPIKSITASFMISEKIGYIKLVRFSENSSKEFYYAAQTLLKKGMKKLVFDLRGNGGGYLQVAENIVDEFLEKDLMMVYTKNKQGKGSKAFSTNNGILKNIELAVLIDSESASASEIVAGAIQDNDRGTIYGRRSYGKGLVQKPVMLTDSSSLRITIAKYYTPTGRCIQKSYENKSHYDYMMEMYDREKSGSLFALDSSIFVDSLKFTTPKGKVVYGGGGISPDIFIPFDTAGYSSFYRKIAYSRVLTEFSINYLSENRKKLSDKSLNHYLKNFTVNDQLFNRFLAFAQSKKINGSSKDISTSKQRLRARIKEEIASGIWDEEGREYINSRTNNDLKIVLENF
ncbi:MAG: carboxyl-terminal processing protease [Flavobacteriales bacterium]|jgi:carboxyl-terminal processing protease|tara:strand:- start:121 stop:1713 length:1593 start_codon:yes stop_codon:yes gene_type:complete